MWYSSEENGPTLNVKVRADSAAAATSLFDSRGTVESVEKCEHNERYFWTVRIRFSPAQLVSIFDAEASAADISAPYDAMRKEREEREKRDKARQRAYGPGIV